MSRARPIYGWDTCVFVAHFNGELDKPLDDIRAVLSEVESDKADMVISITTRIELLDIVRNKKIAKEFDGFVKRPNVLMVNVDPRVADEALLIRVRANDAGRNIKVPDAQIVGTALLHRVDVLHTFDPQLLKLSQHEIVGMVAIRVPAALSGQKTLPISRASKPDGCTLWPSHFRCDGVHPLGGLSATATLQAAMRQVTIAGFPAID